MVLDFNRPFAGPFTGATIPASGFTPSGTPVGWWAADLITGLEDGDPIGTFPDQSGNGHDLVQSGADNTKPTYKTNIQNGLPCARLDGLQDFMKVDFSATFTQPNSWFTVLDFTGVANYSFILGGYTSTTRQDLLAWTSNLAIRLNSGIDVATDKSYSETAELIVAVFDGAGSYVRLDTTQSADVNAGTHSADGLCLGTYYALTGYYAQVDIFDLIFYDGEESPTANEAALNTKWAIY